jgi:poly-alpha-2,8 sialosyl sialyltransferase
MVSVRRCIDMNLFVVSNIGQLYQAQALIRKNGLKQNVIAILYTNLNTTILDYLLGSVDQDLFINQETVLLPNHPNKFSRRKLKKIRDGYEELVGKYDFSSIYICSFESHYNFIKDIATENGMKLMLFEEGTATYKFLIEENDEDPTIKGRLKRALSLSKNDFKRAFMKKQLVIQPIKIALRTLKRIAASFFTKAERMQIKSTFYPSELRSVFKTIEEFDELYVAFPEKAKLIFKAKKYNELISDFSLNEETTELINESIALKHLNSNAVVFVNQRYKVPDHLHVNIILSFLSQHYKDEKIFIKFHPKDSREMKEAFAQLIEEKQLNAEIIDLDIEVPFEAILKVKRPKLVIGISSTSLIYTKKIIPSTETLSCANYYINHLIENRVEEKVIHLITYHKKILETMSDIEVI